MDKDIRAKWQNEYNKDVKQREEHELQVLNWLLTNYGETFGTWPLGQVKLVCQVILAYENDLKQNTKGEAT